MATKWVRVRAGVYKYGRLQVRRDEWTGYWHVHRGASRKPARGTGWGADTLREAKVEAEKLAAKDARKPKTKRKGRPYVTWSANDTIGTTTKGYEANISKGRGKHKGEWKVEYWTPWDRGATRYHPTKAAAKASATKALNATRGGW
jgi:hypothetical protein